MTTLESHYDILGLDRSANEDEIKRAWARLVRVHTPDKDPEGNRRVNEAKTTLLNTDARKDYDALLDYGDEIMELMEEAQTAEEEEDWQTAIRANKEILAFHPTNHAVRNHLALCQSYSGDFASAVKTMEALLQKQDMVALYWSNYGIFLQELADENESLLNKAASAFERASELEPYNAQHHVSLSRHWRARGNYGKAEQCIESAIHADGKIDIDDFDTLFELPWIHLWSREFHKLRQDAERIQQLLPEDNEEAENYASFRFLEIANDAYKACFFEEALEFVKAARVIKKDLGELEPWAKEVNKAARINHQAKLLSKDETILKAVQGIGLIYTDIYLGRSTFDECRSLIDKLIEALDTWSRSEVTEAFDTLKKKYPVLYNLNTELFGRLNSLGQPDSIATPPRYTPTSNGTSSSSNDGSAVLYGAIIGGVIGAIACGWGAIPGAFIGGFIGASMSNK